MEQRLTIPRSRGRAISEPTGRILIRHAVAEWARGFRHPTPHCTHTTGIIGGPIVQRTPVSSIYASPLSLPAAKLQNLRRRQIRLAEPSFRIHSAAAAAAAPNNPGAARRDDVKAAAFIQRRTVRSTPVAACLWSVPFSSSP